MFRNGDMIVPMALPYDADWTDAEPQGPVLPMESNRTELAWGEYTRYYRELLGFLIVKLRCPYEAADLVQETFARVLALNDPAAIRQPRALLYRIARNLAVDSARKQSVRSRHLAELGELEKAPSATPLPDYVLERDQLRHALDQTILAMPQRRRDVFLLYRFGGLKQAEIADRMGISTSMVERHLMKAMAQCREQLRSYL